MIFIHHVYFVEFLQLILINRLLNLLLPHVFRMVDECYEIVMLPCQNMLPHVEYALRVFIHGVEMDVHFPGFIKLQLLKLFRIIHIYEVDVELII